MSDFKAKMHQIRFRFPRKREGEGKGGKGREKGGTPPLQSTPR